MKFETKFNRDAMVVLSGGQDSTTCLFWARQRYRKVHAITFDYGQRHRIEIDAARKIARLAGVETHEIMNLVDILRSTSPLTSNTKLDEYESFEQMEQVVGTRVESTFVPMRNVLFLTVAANRAVLRDCSVLVTGICQGDNANYPDCTNEFRYAMEHVCQVALRGAHELQIAAPLLTYTKAQTVGLAHSLPGCWDALAYTHTSYDGLYPPTGKNHANILRARGFEEAGLPDPLVVRAWKEGLMELPSTSNYDDMR